MARLRVFGFFEFFILRNFETGIFFPFLTPADLRNRPRREGLMRIFLRFLATCYQPTARRRHRAPRSCPAAVARRVEVSCSAYKVTLPDSIGA